MKHPSWRGSLLAGTCLTLALSGSALAQQEQQQQQLEQQQTQQAEQQQGVPPEIDQEGLRQVQEALRQAGHDPGSVDGIWGPETASAVQDFQQAEGLEATGVLDDQTVAALGLQDLLTGQAAAGQQAVGGQGGQQPGAGGEQQEQQPMLQQQQETGEQQPAQQQ